MTASHEQLRLVTTTDLPKHQPTSSQQRKTVGNLHEKRVADRLAKEGWFVANYGVEHFPPEVVEALGRTESPERWRPDFIAVRGLDVIYIDAKGALKSGSQGRRRFVSRDCVRHQMTLTTLGLLRIYYVFDGFEVSTPHDVFERGTLEDHSPVGSGGAYYAINIEHCRSFDQLFGAFQQRVHLRAVA